MKSPDEIRKELKRLYGELADVKNFLQVQDLTSRTNALEWVLEDKEEKVLYSGRGHGMTSIAMKRSVE